MAKKTVKFMLTAFRDGFQSVVGARVLSKDFLPCVEEAYQAGVRWFEAGGGARFQSCYFYCQEDVDTKSLNGAGDGARTRNSLLGRQEL